MRRVICAAALAVFASAAFGQNAAEPKQYVIVLNETERAVMLSLMDAAVRAQGLDVALNAGILARKLKEAGVVTDANPQKEPEK